MSDPVQSEVLHSENHVKLSSEEIAKAVARHKKNHSAAKEDNLALKAQGGGAKAAAGAAKVKKAPKV